jgi:anthranilate/para-aminobenzoate synthase component I
MKRNLIEELIKNKLRKFKEIVENEPELIDYEIISIDEDNYQTACEQIKKKLQEGKVDVMLINKKLSKDIKQISQIDVYKELESQLKKIKFVRYIYFSLLVIFLLAFLLIVYSYITFLKRCGSKAPSVVYIVNT